MSPPIRVGIGEFAVAEAPEVLTAVGLGSCVAVSLYDAGTRRGGLAHVLLPSLNGEARPDPEGTYAPVLVTRLLRGVLEEGGDRARIEAKLAGGANMFGSLGIELGRIGERNVSSVLATLNELGLRIAGRDVGGNFGRTVELDLATGQVRVRSLSRPPLTL